MNKHYYTIDAWIKPAGVYMNYEQMCEALTAICVNNKVLSDIMAMLTEMNARLNDNSNISSRFYRFGVVTRHNKKNEYRLAMINRQLLPTHILKLGLVMNKTQQQIIDFDPKVMELLY